MPHLPQEAHRRRVQRIILGELQLGREDAAFKGRAVGSLDQGFPEEDVVFGDRAGGDAVRRGGGEELVFVEEAAGCYCGCHVGVLGVRGRREEGGRRVRRCWGKWKIVWMWMEERCCFEMKEPRLFFVQIYGSRFVIYSSRGVEISETNRNIRYSYLTLSYRDLPSAFVRRGCNPASPTHSLK